MEKLGVTFLNVGQGDCIVLDWWHKLEKRFALVDCNSRRSGAKATISEVKRYFHLNEVKRLEWVLLTHPHTDHFSGFVELFDFCRSESIVIGCLYHTNVFKNLDKTCAALESYMAIGNRDEAERVKRFRRVITAGVNGSVAVNELIRFYNRVEDERRSADVIQRWSYASEGMTLECQSDNNLQFRLIAPSSDGDMEEYIRLAMEGIAKGGVAARKMNNPAANRISTFIVINDEEGDWQFWLTSDCDKLVQERITANVNPSRALLGAQIPHHGSAVNHCPTLWTVQSGAEQSTYFISVGGEYRHPSRVVIDFFRHRGQHVRATNYVNGYKESFDDDLRVDMTEVIEGIYSTPGIGSVVRRAGKQTDRFACGSMRAVVSRTLDLKPRLKVEMPFATKRTA